MIAARSRALPLGASLVSLVSLVSGASLLLTACSGNRAQGPGQPGAPSGADAVSAAMVADPRPARLTVPDRAAQLQIQGQINSWLEGPPVVLEDQAFAAYHRVTLVPASGRALDRPNGVDGRRVGAPEQFDLLLAGGAMPAATGPDRCNGAPDCRPLRARAGRGLMKRQRAN